MRGNQVERDHNKVIDNLALTYRSTVNSGDTPKADGVVLANDCLRQLRELNNPERFPPSFLPGFKNRLELYHLLRANVQTGIRICSAGDIRGAKQGVLYE